MTFSLTLLLALVAVALLTLSSVSLRQSGASDAKAIARNNARLALFLALGEIQKQLGPDQRVTALADLAGDSTGAAIPPGDSPGNLLSVNGIGNGLSPVQPGTRYWTGVWKNNASRPGEEIYSSTPSPVISGWLVSGNEGRSLENLLTPSLAAHALGPDGEPTSPNVAVVLAGKNTLGPPVPGTLDRYVSAPLIPIKRGAAAPAGRYAWWVGDEGLKARINLPKSSDDPKTYASLAAQRRGWETVTGFSDYPDPSSPLHDSLPKIITLDSTEFLLRAPSAAGAKPMMSAFHSATTDSRGLITDTLSGGTRIDLSAILAAPLPPLNPFKSVPNYPIRNRNIIPRTIARGAKGPKWDTVKDFHDRFANLTDGNLIVRPAAADTAPSLAPTIIDFRILMGVKFIPQNQAPSTPAATFKAHACGKVAIAIANPYPYPLQWKDDLEFEIKNQTPPGNSPSRIFQLGSDAVFISGQPGESSVFHKSVFRIRPASLAPGEARAFTIGANHLRPLGTGTQRIVVDLVPFQSASPLDFNHCIELESRRPSVPPLTLDIRESWQTTLVTLEMRLAGVPKQSQPLRRIERFELDNALFDTNPRTFTLADCQQTTLPVPLMLYSFQISQPGVDYKALMPPSYSWGQRGSSLRTYADFNLQATRFSKPIASYNPPPFFMERSDSHALLPSSAPGGNTGSAFTRNLVMDPVPWGRSPSGSRKTVLFGLPSDLSSLAQLQHADLTADDISASVGHQPGNAFANSHATPFVKRSLTLQNRTDYELIGSREKSGAIQIPRFYFDISYLLNAAVWDSYFLSTIPASATKPYPRNPTFSQLRPGTHAPALRDPVLAATHLIIEGAFNINSTDKNAWKAFLASARNFRHPADSPSSPDAAFPRSLEQPASSASPPTGSADDSYSGFRRLSDAELDALATELVKQVRLRGPFLSISHFINRAIADINSHPALTRSGALQFAIDEAGLNINHDGTRNAFSQIDPNFDRLNLSEIDGRPAPDLDGEKTSNRPSDADPQNPDWAARSRDLNFGSVASIIADREMIRSGPTQREQGYRSTGIPGWLTQADVLQVIGSSITARSDTFRIRAYGEALKPDGKTAAKAWCEAIIQRMPHYIDSTNAASDREPALTPTNRIHGRAFKISSFRWLSSDDI